MNLESLTKLRKELHEHPELSGDEASTAKRITKILKDLQPDELITGIGGHGIAAKFSASEKSRETLLFRSELDAIAVGEETVLEYRSKKGGVMHGCGHDGHMAILIGLAQELSQKRSKNSDVWVLFQPAEETGEGASAMLSDPKFKDVEADQAFALHNLPGFPEGEVVIKESVFAAASVGLDILFKGKSSHAAYPEQGVNPSGAIGELIRFVARDFEEFKSEGMHNKIVTTYVKLGERAFGISPGEGRVGFTIRSESDAALKSAVEKVKRKVNKLHSRFKGDISVEEVEPFAATINHAEGVRRVRAAAKDADFETNELNEPFPWSEDFGEFRNKFPITLFGLGSGEDHPPLHSEMYDFNDELIEKGVRIFRNIIETDLHPHK